MRVVIAPDSFKGSMSADAAAKAMRRGVHDVCPDIECQLVPMADGGEGTVAALVAARRGELRTTVVSDPWDRPVTAVWGLLPDATAVIEAAAVVGLHLRAPEGESVLDGTTAGLAELIEDVAKSRARRVIVGLGGTGTNDGGAGLLERAGARFFDADGHAVRTVPSQLGTVERVDMTGIASWWKTLDITIACDVQNPLSGSDGATQIFGPQKGVRERDLASVDSALSNYGTRVEHAIGRTLSSTPGAGAAGGLGFAFMALGATRRSGVETVIQATGLRQAIAGADLVLTGEGSIDSQTLYGKTPAGVAAVAAENGVPVIAFAGNVSSDADALLQHGFGAILPIVHGPVTLAEALRDGEKNLRRSVASAMRVFEIVFLHSR